MPCTKDGCREFFKEYDELFLSGANSVDLYDEAVDKVLKLLGKRVNERAAGSDDPSDPSDEQVDAIERLAAAQLALFELQDQFVDKNGLDYDCIQKCFEMFANGELRTGPGKREPNGAFFFFFAEFATLAIDHGNKPGVWKKLLETFVKCQEIFIEVYPPTVGGNRVFRRGRNFGGKKEQVGEKKKKKLRKKYDGMDEEKLREKHKENAGEAKTQDVASLQGDPFERATRELVDRELREMDELVTRLRESGGLPEDDLVALASLSEVVSTLVEVLVLGSGGVTRVGFLGADTEAVVGDGTNDGESRAGPRSPTVVEGLGVSTAAALAEVGIETLGDLAAADRTREVPEVERESFESFVDMAALLEEFDGLTRQDAQVLVEGLGVSGVAELREAARELTEDDLARAVEEVEVPEGYEPAGLRQLLAELGEQQ